jgi:L-lactate dehydrogenase complex protein LldG
MDSAAAPAYRRVGGLPREACLALFIDRLVDYDAAVLQVNGEADLSSAVASSLAVRREQSVVVDAALPGTWLPPGVRIAVDHPASGAPLSVDQLEGIEAVITTCEIAVASTGTIVLRHTGAQGRRSITLLPDHHICLVRRSQVCEVLPEALQRMDPSSTAPITTISGPSATSDIEMTRIRGVHGPRRLTVILYGEN